MHEPEALIEGCYHDGPSLLQFCIMPLRVPDNAHLLAFAHDRIYEGKGYWQQYVLLGKTDTYAGLDTSYDGHTSEVRGNGIELDSSMRWCFEAARSFLMSDGRLFVQRLYVEDPTWRLYVDNGLEHFLQAMRHVWAEKKDIDEINERGLRWF